MQAKERLKVVFNSMKKRNASDEEKGMILDVFKMTENIKKKLKAEQDDVDK